MNSDVLGRYRLLERLGVGGMAEVFFARSQGVAAFTRTVVVKRMLPQLASDPASVAMFLDEARLGAKLQHANIVAVVDLGEAGDHYFMVLEHVDGADLGVLLARARARGLPLPVSHSAYIGSKTAQGLHFAHSARDPETRLPLGVVHRDVSPSNILVSRSGDVKIADFGVARSNMQSEKTAAGAVKGKLAYMSPEQLNGEPLDARSDVFALGLVLWELLAGHRLYEGTPAIQAIQSKQPPPPSSKNPAVPAALDALVFACLAPDRAQRPSTASDVAEALDRWLTTQPGSARLAFEKWTAEDRGMFDPDPNPDSSAVTIATSPDHAVREPSRTLKTPVNIATSLLSSPGGLRKVREPRSPPLPGLKVAQRGPDRKRGLVLYVEDEVENRDVAELRLRRSYELLLAATDQEACQLVRERGSELSAILMDIQLKGSTLDGIELVKLIRGTLPEAKKPPYAHAVPVLDVPIFFVTAYGARYAEPELLAVGAQKLVTKPVNFSELTLALVDVHLKRAHKA